MTNSITISQFVKKMASVVAIVANLVKRSVTLISKQEKHCHITYWNIPPYRLRRRWKVFAPRKTSTTPRETLWWQSGRYPTAHCHVTFIFSGWHCWGTNQKYQIYQNPIITLSFQVPFHDYKYTVNVGEDCIRVTGRNFTSRVSSHLFFVGTIAPPVFHSHYPSYS